MQYFSHFWFLFVIGTNAACSGSKKIAFVMARVVDSGNMGGIEGANQLCSEATLLGFSVPYSEYRAWLSNSTLDAIDNLGLAPSTCIETSNGDTFVNTLQDLLDTDMPLRPLIYDEHGRNQINRSPTKKVYTGTRNGRVVDTPTNRCNEWTSSNGKGVFGELDKISTWSDSRGTEDCDKMHHIYCFQVGVEGTRPPTPAPTPAPTPKPTPCVF